MSKTTGALPVVRRIAARCRLAPRRRPRPARRVSEARSRGRSATPSSPTASNRRGPLGRGGARCRRRSHLHRRASASTGRAPCPDRGAASARRGAGSEKRAHFRVPTGRQRPQARAVRHDPPPGHRQMPQPGDACCYRAFRKCPSGWGLGVSTTSVSPDRRAVTRMRAVQFTRFRE